MAACIAKLTDIATSYLRLIGLFIGSALIGILLLSMLLCWLALILIVLPFAPWLGWNPRQSRWKVRRGTIRLTKLPPS